MEWWRPVDTLGYPGTTVKSLFYSRGLRRRGGPRLPIVAAWDAKLKKAPSANLKVDGQLFLGLWPEKRFGRNRWGARPEEGIGPPACGARTVVELHPGATLVAEGWVLLGPGVRIVVGPGATLRIGDGTYLSGNSQILCRRNIEIGTGCTIAWDGMIMDSDSHVLKVGGRQRAQTVPVEIGNRVWIGAGVTVLKGAQISDGVVIGAGSVVTGHVPAKTVAAGTRARVIADDAEWE